MSESRLACRLRATWTEGDALAWAGFRPTADTVASGVHRVTAEFSRFVASQPVTAPAVADVIRRARSLGLPSVYDPDGMTFGQTIAVHLEHEGIEIGRAAVMGRAGNRFEALGWVHPDYSDAAREAAHVSPALFIDDAEIAAFGGVDVMNVTASQLIELSLVARPARKGTTVEVSRPKPVPLDDWPLLLTPGSAFDPNPVDEAFGEIEGPFRLAFDGPVTTF